MSLTEPILVRPPHGKDQNYVTSTWVNSLVCEKEWTRRDCRNVVDDLLERKDTRLRLAAIQSDPNSIVGWIAYVEKPAVLHYVYVRNRYRGHGVGRMLVDAAGLLKPPALVYTLRGPSWKQVIDKHPNLVHINVREFIL